MHDIGVASQFPHLPLRAVDASVHQKFLPAGIGFLDPFRGWILYQHRQKRPPAALPRLVPPGEIRTELVEVPKTVDKLGSRPGNAACREDLEVGADTLKDLALEFPRPRPYYKQENIPLYCALSLLRISRAVFIPTPAIAPTLGIFNRRQIGPGDQNRFIKLFHRCLILYQISPFPVKEKAAENLGARAHLLRTELYPFARRAFHGSSCGIWQPLREQLKVFYTFGKVIMTFAKVIMIFPKIIMTFFCCP